MPGTNVQLGSTTCVVVQGNEQHRTEDESRCSV